MDSDPVETTLGEICRKQGGLIQTGPFGSQLHASDYTLTGTPIVMPINLIDRRIDEKNIARVTGEHVERLSRHKLELGDIVFSRRGDVTRFALVSEREAGWLCGTGCLKVAVGKPMLAMPQFIAAILASPESKEWLVRHAVGATMPNLNTEILSNIPITLPPIAEQRAIASILGALNEKIDLNRRINQTLETMAQAIFKSWFVDFDPVKAKIAAIEQGEDPLRAAMRAISGKTDTELDQMPPKHRDQLATTAALFSDAMEESELGNIPKGWTHGFLGDVCSFTAGSAFKPEHQGSKEGDYPFIKVSDMNLAGNEVFIQSANNYVSKAQQSEMKAKLHPLGATIFAKIGVALISNRRRLLTTPTIIDNNLMSASPEGKSGEYFLYSMLSIIDFNTLVSGTALPYLNVSDLKKIPIVRPPHDVSGAFDRKVSSIFSLMQTLAVQSATLSDTRDTLLPKLLSGKLAVADMEVSA